MIHFAILLDLIDEWQGNIDGIEKPTPSTSAVAIFIELIPTSCPDSLINAPPEFPD